MATGVVTRPDEVSRDMWWIWMLRSVLILIFGFVALVWPGLTLGAIAIAVALLFVVGGIVDVIGSVRAFGRGGLWFMTLLLGLLEIGVGVFLLRHTKLELGIFIALVGISFLIKGVTEIVAAFEPRYDGGTKFLLAVLGLISLLAGTVMLVHPVSAGLAFTWVLGLYGILAGTMGMAFALSVHSAINGRR